MNDFIYYLKVGNDVLDERIFETEKDAIDFATKESIQDYVVIEWDVD